MKLNRLFLLAAMGLGLFACNDNDLVEGRAPNGTQEEGTTYVGFSLKFSNTNTRAEGDLATEEESHITSAYVMMADASGNVEQIVSTADSGKGDNNTNTNYYVFQTTAGVHYFYAVVNPDVIPTITEANNGTAETIEKYFNTGVALTVATIASTTGEGNFMMASDAVKEVYVEDGVTKDEALKGTKNCFAIQVERATAKVTMTCPNATLESESGTTNVGGKINNLQFYLMGEATKSYRMASTPNLNLSRTEGITDRYSFESDIPAGITINTGANQNKTQATPVYCLENLQDDYKQGNTTYILLKTDFIPTKIVDCTKADGTTTNNDNTSDTAESFYVVKSGDLAGNYIIKEDLDTYKQNHQNQLPQGVLSISDEYKDGTCWFGPIWVGQENADNNGPVKRNTWYNLNINKIKLPGDPNAPEINESQPLVPNTNVAITLDVLDWVSADRNISLQ